MAGRATRTRLLAAAAALGVGAVAALGPHSPARAADAAPRTDPVAVDRQGYVSGAPVDPYNKDTLNMHVGVVGGTEVARSFVHLSFDGLPSGATLRGASLKVVRDETQTDNVNDGAAIVQACVLTQELAAQFDPAHPPPYDCSKGSSVGKAVEPGTWAFDLGNLISYWGRAGNTGAAIVPVGAPGDTWSVGFDKGRSGGTAIWWAPGATPAPTGPSARGAAPASAPQPETGAAAAPSTGTGIVAGPVLPLGSGSTSTGGPASPAAAASGAVAQNGSPAAPSTGARTVPGHRSHAWVWVLLAALLAAAVLAAQPVAAIATAGAGKIRHAFGRQFRSHARAMLTSAVLVVWTITYAIYSVVVSPSPRLLEGTIATRGATPPGASAEAAGGAASGSGTPGVAAGGAASGSGVAAAAGRRASAASGGGAADALPADEANLPPAARLFGAADDRIGITDTTITLCGHAALTFGPAFNIGKNDINVFWQNINDHGGIHGRKFKVDWQDDSYQPGPAVTAAQTCKDQGTFMLLGGIGFDQIPAVRVWAEQNHELYLHHVAVQRGSEGLRYSFTALPSVEQMGRTFGQLAVQKYKGMKVGILWRNSSNWQPGRDEFRRQVQAAGMQIVGDFPVQNNQGNYTQQIVELKSAGAQVVFAWENALAATEMLRQAKAQAYSPHWLLFPFNLTLQTVGNDALNPPLDGLAAWPAYTADNHDGPYASYAADLAEFERQYKQYDPNANLAGPGGDLLFLAWTGFKQLADMFGDCGRGCTRNKFAALMLNGYHKTVTPNCDADFSGGDRHHAAPRMDVLATTAGPNGQPMWIPTRRCIPSL